MNENETMYDGFNPEEVEKLRARKRTKAPTTTTTQPPPRYTTPLVLLVIDGLDLESEESDQKTTPRLTTVTPSTTISTSSIPGITTPPVTDGSGGEDDERAGPGDDGEGIQPITDEPDYDSEEKKDDPCNYEKYPHPLPNIIRTNRRVSAIKCEEYMWRYKIEEIDRERNRLKCKENSPDDTSEIFGGAKALQGDFPHMGAVGWVTLDGGMKWMCGSTLISPMFTLTAAHCRLASRRMPLKYFDPKMVRFGSVFLYDTNRTRYKDVKIKEFLVMDEYRKNPLQKYNDIGLIRLEEEVKMTLTIRPACLWSGYLVGEVANITGWGKVTTNEDSASKYLRYAEVDVYGVETCKKYVRGRNNRKWPKGLVEHQFCAGKLEGGIDACQGDSGGPLQIRQPMPMDNTHIFHYVAGITSFGIKCGIPNLPGVYTNVSHHSFMCWIEKTVWPEEKNDFC
ncbi:serine protease snake-like [Ostrinia nubilalis]|uniref:serine protease snake-like n=1 Tax=Ostrinia nubilalis TaxID=29057 RepID=UPI003082513B